MLPFWGTRAAWRAWAAAFVSVATIYGGIRFLVWSNRLTATLTQATLEKSGALVWSTLYALASAAAFIAVNGAISRYARGLIVIDWRCWLTARFAQDWMADGTFYRLERDALIDNIDQRLSEDCHLAVRTVVTMSTDLLSKVGDIFAFSAILWTMGGVENLHRLGIPLIVPGGMVWIAVLFQGFGSALIVWLGRPLIRLSVARQKAEADFRFALINVRLNAEQIALYQGERSEGASLRHRVDRVVTNWHSIMNYNARVLGFGQVHGHARTLLALLLPWERFLDGRIAYGDTFVLWAAFLRVCFGLNWLIYWFAQNELYTWAAAVRRLDGLRGALDGEEVRGIALRAGPVGGASAAVLSTAGLCLARPDGTPLAKVGDVCFAPAERWLVRGPSGVGKSTFLRALAGLWPYGTGEVGWDRSVHMLFVPQKAYIAQGSLHDALCYPSPPGRFAAQACAQALMDVRLPRLADSLEEIAPWQQRLSPGEQQRIAFARILLQGPDAVLLDEATSALDPDTEQYLYALIQQRLPDATIISVAHRESLHACHSHHLLINDGAQEQAHSSSRIAHHG